MDSETRCNSFKVIKTRIIIPHKSYYGDLPKEIIINDLNYLKTKSKVGYGIYPLYKNLVNVINKLKDEKYYCQYYNCNYVSLDEKEVVYMFLIVLDYIVKKISSDSYFRKLTEKIQEDLNIRVHNSSMKTPVNNSS